MATITIARQMGSMGCEIAQMLAKEMGYQLVWRDLINRAARRAGVPEMALAAIDELGLLDICPSPKACEDYRQAVRQIMGELWDQGNVIIIGRAGQAILMNYDNVLHLRLIAPKGVRAERIALRHKISYECALAQIEESDRYRSSYLKRFYGVDWSDPALYHLIINTGKLESHSAVKIIENAVTHMQHAHNRDATRQQPDCSQ